MRSTSAEETCTREIYIQLNITKEIIMSNKIYYFSKQINNIVLCQGCAHIVFDEILHEAKTIKNTIQRNQTILDFNLYKIQATHTDAPCQGSVAVYGTDGHPCNASQVETVVEDAIYLHGANLLQNFICFFDPVSSNYNQNNYDIVPIYTFKINTEHAYAQNLITKEKLLERWNIDKFAEENYTWNVCAICLNYLGPIWLNYLDQVFKCNLQTQMICSDALHRLIQDSITEYKNNHYLNYGVCSYGNCKADYVQSLPDSDDPSFKDASYQLHYSNFDKINTFKNNLNDASQIIHPQSSQETIDYFRLKTKEIISSVIYKATL